MRRRVRTLSVIVPRIALLSCFVADRAVHGIVARIASVLLIYSFAAFILCSLRVEASLRIVGSPRHAAVWQQAYDHLPCCWKTDRTVTVLGLSDSDMVAFITRNGGRARLEYGNNRSTVDGCYQKGGDDKGNVGTIRLCDCREEPQSAQVFLHEYGHFVWDEKLVKKQREDFKRLWRRQKTVGRLVTKYAGDNVEEGFAEVMAHFLRQPGVLRECDPASYAFIADLSGGEAPRRGPAQQANSRPEGRALLGG